jgi:hypothetical protein
MTRSDPEGERSRRLGSGLGLVGRRWRAAAGSYLQYPEFGCAARCKGHFCYLPPQAPEGAGLRRGSSPEFGSFLQFARWSSRPRSLTAECLGWLEARKALRLLESRAGHLRLERRLHGELGERRGDRALCRADRPFGPTDRRGDPARHDRRLGLRRGPAGGGGMNVVRSCTPPFPNVGRSWSTSSWPRPGRLGQTGISGRYVAWHEGGQTDRIGCLAGGYTRAKPGGVGTLRRGKVNSCVWWGQTKDSRPKVATWGEHLTPVLRAEGEERSACADECGGVPNPWVDFKMPPMAYYLWASGHYAKHVTDCIDC